MRVTIMQGDDPSEAIKDFEFALQLALIKAKHDIVETNDSYEAIIFLGHSQNDQDFTSLIIDGLEFGGGFIFYHAEFYQHPEFFDLTEIDASSEVHNLTFAITEIAEIIKQLAH